MGLEQIPDNWIGVISALAGGLLVGLFALISKYIDKVSEAKTITRNKLEELHFLIIGYVSSIEMVQDQAYGKIPVNADPRMLAEHFKKILFDPMIKMSALQSLYAPTTGEAFTRLGDLAVKYVLAATDFMHDLEIDNTTLDASYRQMMDSTTEAIEEVENFIFRSKLIPNQTLLDAFRASWKYAGKRADKTRKSTK